MKEIVNAVVSRSRTEDNSINDFTWTCFAVYKICSRPESTNVRGRKNLPRSVKFVQLGVIRHVIQTTWTDANKPGKNTRSYRSDTGSWFIECQRHHVFWARPILSVWLADWRTTRNWRRPWRIACFIMWRVGRSSTRRWAVFRVTIHLLFLHELLSTSTTSYTDTDLLCIYVLRNASDCQTVSLPFVLGLNVVWEHRQMVRSWLWRR